MMQLFVQQLLAVIVQSIERTFDRAEISAKQINQIFSGST
jgi:hypothetical protein